MNETSEIRILVVEDHPIVRFGLATFLDSQEGMTVVGEAETGEQSVAMSQADPPDLVVMDLQLPGISGVEAIARIRRQSPKTRFVVLTTYEGDEDIHRALEAGARAYLIKGMPLDSLADAVRKVHAGGRVLPTPVADTLSAWTPNSELTPRERDVLALIVEGKSNRKIAEQLAIAEGTVKCHVNVIFRRLDVTGRAEAAAVALRRGIVHL